MTPEQTKSLLWGNIGIAAFAVLFAALLQMLDGWPGPLPDPAERISLAFKLSVLPVGFLAFVGVIVLLTRLVKGPVDPAGDDPAAKKLAWRAVDRRVLSNTFTQTIAFLPLYFATAMVIGPDESAYLTALPLTFVAARLAFWAGYRISSLCRVPGMAAGFVINLGMLWVIAFRIF